MICSLLSNETLRGPSRPFHEIQALCDMQEQHPWSFWQPIDKDQPELILNRRPTVQSHTDRDVQVLYDAACGSM